MHIVEREKLGTEIESLKDKYGQDRSALLPILQELKERYSHLSDIIMQEVAHSLDIHPVEVMGVVTFYHFLKTEKQGKYIIRLCNTICCDLAGKERIARQLENELGIKFGQTTQDKLFSLEYTSCVGMCDQGPALLINDRVFTKVTPDKVPIILEECKRGFAKSEFPEIIPSDLKKEGDLLKSGVKMGEALKKALSMKRPDVIATIRDSSLKGRGGAGFPTAVKWQLAATAKGEDKHVVCNADEGEPGTFKDRFLLYEHTDQVLDGMTIAGYAIGAKKGYIYLRGEYQYLRDYLEKALDSRRKQGWLGKNIAESNHFEFDIEIRMGAGAYICGEETALIESIEGFRGEARNRPPFPVNTGFMGTPTIVNNVETFMDASLIIAKGADWFKQHGTEKSTGMKILSISGDCTRPGIYELPFGITVVEMLKEVGGEEAKAVQIGGASGHCIPARDFNRTLGYEDIATGGSVIIFGPHRDMLKVAKNFMEFFVEESCGQCTPCRDGNVKLLERIKLLEQGKCSMRYLNELIKLGQTMQIASKCGLGQSSPNAFISIMTNFKEEVLGRITQESV
jgi:[NiFe] hydrogenase diaphorase moiety large subunit